MDENSKKKKRFAESHRENGERFHLVLRKNRGEKGTALLVVGESQAGRREIRRVKKEGCKKKEKRELLKFVLTVEVGSKNLRGEQSVQKKRGVLLFGLVEDTPAYLYVCLGALEKGGSLSYLSTKVGRC